MKYRKTTIAIILCVICAIFILFSYKNARIVADDTMKPFLKNDLCYYGMSFQPLQVLIEKKKFKNWWGPSWYVTYDGQTLMTEPLSVRVNLFGKITATNPNNLIQDIIPRYLRTNTERSKP